MSCILVGWYFQELCNLRVSHVTHVAYIINYCSATKSKANMRELGRAKSWPKFGLPATVSTRPPALFSVLWRARLLENSQARAGGAFERGSNWIRMPEHTATCSKRARCEQTACLRWLPFAASIFSPSCVRPFGCIADWLPSQTFISWGSLQTAGEQDAEWNCAQRHSPGVAKNIMMALARSSKERWFLLLLKGFLKGFQLC